MRVQVSGSRVTAWAPCKINLFLEVLGRRPDGFHEIETVMTTVNLFDTLQIDCQSDPGGIDLQVVGPHAANIPSNESNLVVRALRGLLEMAATD